MALQALASAARQHGQDEDVLSTLTPMDLARAWRVHPSSAFRVLERLRKDDRSGAAVRRTGTGLKAEYEITEAGLKKLAYLQRLARFHEGLKKGKTKKDAGIAANPEDGE